MKVYTVVEPGDSLWRIAERSNIAMETIKQLNKGKGARGNLLAYESREPAWGLDYGDVVFLSDSSEIGVDGNSDEGLKTVMEVAGSGPLNELLKTTTKKNTASRETRQETTGTSVCPTCDIYSVSVKCSHYKDRNYSITYDSDTLYGPHKPSVLFEVIAGKEGDELEFEIVGKGCGYGLSPNLCPAIDINGGEYTITQSNNKFTANGPEIGISDDGILYFLENVMYPKTKYKSYKLSDRVCKSNFSLSSEIRAYTPVEWDGKMEIGYFHPPKTKKKKTLSKIKKQGYWGVMGGLSVAVDGFKYAIETPQATGKVKKNLTKEIFNNSSKVLADVVDLLDRLPKKIGKNAKAEIKWPKFLIGGHMKTVEVHGAPEVGIAGSVKLGFEPFIGLELSVDILGVLISTLGKTHPFIAAIEVATDYIDKIESVEMAVEILIKCEAAIQGTVEWNFGKDTAPKPTPDLVGKLGAGLDLTIEGVAKAKLDTFILSVEAGATVGAKSGFGVVIEPRWSSEGGIEVESYLEFRGLKAYFMTYVSFNGPKEVGTPGKASGGKEIIVWKPVQFGKSKDDAKSIPIKEL